MDVTQADIATLRTEIGSGRLSVPQVVEAHLDRIAALDAGIGAYVHVDADGARQAALARPAGPLAGIPFGVKDVLDTADMPTEQGSTLYSDYQPPFDAGSVARLRHAGGIVLGKTATAEFAGTAPAATCHPKDPSRTPGGSSSGSAAAVAAGMATFALGTQTGGSVMRPAAFCGVAGFKPTFGSWPISGMLPAAHGFDTVGVIARSANDLAEVHAAMMRLPVPSAPETVPSVGLCRTHLWDTVSEEAARVVEAAAQAFSRAGARVADVPLPQEFAALTAHRRLVNAFERAANMEGWAGAIGSARTESQEVFSRGLTVDGASYIAAAAALDRARADLDALFGDHAILLTAVTPGVAPVGLGSTGDPRLQELWSTLRCPAVTVTFGTGTGGLPLGVQLVARPWSDLQLLDAARWLETLRS
ncbi:amidase [Chachezhania sediminis]|uniref:amidase n=1 Tax=Chachezhania sediminis TaxID=2599291 RepID=UPI00131ABB91|nr:amidase [Chachezhania sediminis]